MPSTAGAAVEATRAQTPTQLRLTAADAVREQVDRLVRLGYPGVAGLSEAAFRSRLEPLQRTASELGEIAAPGAGRAGLVVVVTRTLADPEVTVPLLRLAPAGRKPGILDRNHGPEGLAPYAPIDAVELPAAAAYLLVDVDGGEEFRGVPPEEALPVILSRGRTPLTIEEGIAVATHAPALLERNSCWMLSGSRRRDSTGRRRVPALWISQNAHKLGWCWDGYPHSWLGVASAGRRLG